MPSSDMTLHRALVVRALDQEVFVKIPAILGANESITVHKPNTVGSEWPPNEGDQLLVAIEGENFNKVYIVCNITDTAGVASNDVNGGSA